MMADLARIKRNVSKMVGLNAPEADIDAYIASEGVTIEDVRDYKPDEAQADAATENQKTTGLLENIGAGIDEGVNTILGAPVDAPVFVGNVLINAGNAGIEAFGGGRPIPNIPDDLPGSRKGFERVQGQLGFTPPSDVVPADEGQHLARVAAEGVSMAALPEIAAIRAGQVASKLPAALQSGAEAAGQLFGQSRNAGQFTRNMVTNAAAASGADLAAQAAPDPLKPLAALAGGVGAATAAHGVTALPGVLQAGARMAGDYLAPMTQAGRERLAGETIRDAATDAGAVREALANPIEELVPGSSPTTFQATGDMGLGALERGVATRNPDAFNQRRADQNAAQIAAARGIQEGGAPEAVTNALRSQLEEIDARTYEQVQQATEAAQRRAAAIGRGRAPESVGDTIRTEIETARAAAKEREQALWGAVDPDGTLALSPARTKQAAKQIVDETPASARQPSGEEASIFGLVERYGDTIPLRELSALHSRIKDAMRGLRVNGLGETAGYRRLTQLNNSVFADLNEAVVAKVAQEERAVAAGQMSFEDTMLAKLQRESEDWFAGRSARALSEGGGEGIGAGGSGRSSSVAGVFRAERQGGGRSNAAPRDPRLSGDGLEPNFDEAALERLNAARAFTQDRVNRFNNNTIAPARQRPSTQSPYDMQSASVPGRFFHAGAKAFDDIAALRRAIGDKRALSMLEPYVIDRLRAAAMREDGILDPAKVASWRRSHSDALRAFPALDARIKVAAQASDAVETSAKARKVAVDEAQKGVAGRLLGLEDPADVVRTVGAVFSRQDAASQMIALRARLGGNKQALEGLRKAVVDYVTGRFIGNTEAGTSGVGTVKSDGFQTFVKQNKGALRAAGFTDEEMSMMDRIAQDLQRTNRSIASVKLPGGSNTAQDLLAAKAVDNGQTIFSKALATTAMATPSFALGGPLGGFVTLLGADVVNRMRAAGLETVNDLVKDAMLNPSRARYLLMKATPANTRMAGNTLGQMYRRAALVSQSASINQ